MVDRATTRNLHVGNTLAIPFQINQFGTKAPWNLSTATRITLDAQCGSVKFSLVADPAYPNANWGAGSVIIQVGPSDLSSIEGTWDCVLTIAIGTETLSLPHDATFAIESLPHPGV